MIEAATGWVLKAIGFAIVLRFGVELVYWLLSGSIQRAGLVRDCVAWIWDRRRRRERIRRRWGR